jgi:hypothetical protein
MSKCKCGARIAKLERQVDRLTANLPKEIHHAVRTELRVERNTRDTGPYMTPWRNEVIGRPVSANPCQIFSTGSDTYSDGS